jgi:hypothetical protein
MVYYLVSPPLKKSKLRPKEINPIELGIDNYKLSEYNHTNKERHAKLENFLSVE